VLNEKEPKQTLRVWPGKLQGISPGIGDPKIDQFLQSTLDFNKYSPNHARQVIQISISWSSQSQKPA